MPTPQRPRLPVPTTSTTTSSGSGSGSSGRDHNNPYLAASLATQLRITPPTGDTTPTALAGHATYSPGARQPKSPVRLKEEDLNDTPGESDPTVTRMDLSVLPKSYLEVS
jgi:hypothetical protein